MTAGSVGRVSEGGKLSAGVKGNQVWVNAYNGVGITVDVDPDEVEAFAEHLARCARAAKQNRPRR